MLYNYTQNHLQLSYKECSVKELLKDLFQNEKRFEKVLKEYVYSNKDAYYMKRENTLSPLKKGE